MKAHTNGFKTAIKTFGREIDSVISYTLNGNDVELGNENLNSISPHYEGAILKSVMKQLDIDSNVDIPLNTVINYQLGIKVGNSYEYIDYGNYVVIKSEKKEDTNSYQLTCYDKMIYAMKEYENSNITFPITIRDYINAISTKMGLVFQNASDTFANYDKVLNGELYLDADNNSMGYTFRDVLDELAEVTASTICINASDKLEIRYISQAMSSNLIGLDTKQYRVSLNAGDKITMKNTGTQSLQLNLFTNYGDTTRNDYWSLSDGSTRTITIAYNSGAIAWNIEPNGNAWVNKGESILDYEPYGDTIDEEYFKDINVNFGEKFGAVNTIILSRSAGADKISLSNPTNLPDADKIAIEICDNQIMNDNNRDTYMSDILTKLYGLGYYINNFSSYGICYYDLCDKYNVSIGGNIYSCIMFNDQVNVTQGLEEIVYTEMQEENETDYKYTSSTDKGITQATLIAKKNEGEITAITSRVDSAEGKINMVEAKQTSTDATINIISKNIDSNGNITEVTTTTGFTFNADGMTITDSETNFSSLHRNTGTYYYDGDAIVGQYTKDGSKQKDLQLFGVYYYGMDEIDDTPMFVAQLYTDANGEETVGHFWNKGD